MNEEYLPPDSEASMEIAEAAPSTLAVITQSEHAAMVTTANLPANKRSLDIFGKKLMAYATHSQPVAISMFYSLPRAGKQIIGASVRFAEVVAPCWKNNSTGSRMIGATDKTVTAQGVFIDYEANLRNVKEIPRKITDSKGNTYSEDMILTTSKACLSIAYREAILKGGVPMALWTPAYEQAKLTAVGQAMSHSQRIDTAMDYLLKLGVTEWQILNSVGVSTPKELEIEHLVTLKTLCEEVKKGARSIEDAFGSVFDKEIESLFNQLQYNAAQRENLKKGHKGNAEGLVKYLREKVKPLIVNVAKESAKVQAQKEKPAEQATEQASKTEASTEQAKTEPAQDTEEKRKRGRPKKIDSAPEEKPDTQPETQAQETKPAQEEKPAQQESARDTQGKPEIGKFMF